MSDRPSPEGLDVLTLAPELGRMYEPVAGDLVALNTYLAEEFRSTEPFVHDLLIHIARFRGKQIRPAVLFLAVRAVAMAEADARVGHDHVKCGGVVELIHTATLVHDDILDDASVRRRVTTVNAMYGNQVPVLLGDFIYAHAFAMSVELPTPEASRVLARVTKIVLSLIHI